MLAVNVVVPSIANVENSIGIFVIFACHVNLQLNAHVAIAFTVELGCGLVVVGMNCLIGQLFVATVAVGIVIVALIVGVVVVDEALTSGAIAVVIVSAGGAEGVRVGACVFAAQDQLAAITTGGGQFVQAVGAEQFAVYKGELTLAETAPAFAAGGGIGVGHMFLHEMKIRLPVAARWCFATGFRGIIYG